MDKHIKRYILVVGLVAGVLWTAAGYVQAQEAPENPPFNKEEMKEKWKAKKEALHKKLGITPEQAEKLDAQKAKHREGLKTLWEEIKAKREALAAELQKKEVNLDAVSKLHNELKALNAQKEDQRLEGILAAREVLTPEQFSQMMEFGKEHRGKGRQSKRFHEDGEYGNGGGPAKTDAE
ncbi:MAG: hypothetical protein A3C36_01715 [Omnitrophica WOR_2 bacterium RIFCSPHIGHO2_02_FULL_52_10]|nr:MAG: hypothetical protein A3C36_01715 [Omnitrophica WOR_2 bacterium RIFCSPHIGHO2_02_FULL_52_10]